MPRFWCLRKNWSIPQELRIIICNNHYNKPIFAKINPLIMAGRPKHYTDEELIDRAIQVFWQKGYHAASAQDLMQAMDIGQGSFYRSFPGGKKELYQRSLIRFLQKSNQAFYAGLAESDDPIQFIRHFFYRLNQRSAQERLNGCYLGNAVVELSNLDEETQILASKLLEKLMAGFEKALIDAQRMGKFDAGKSPKVMAMYLLNLWNGINVTQRVLPQNQQLKEVIDLNLQVL